jgi:NAD(P)H-dependent flavin oxidoreductase YrpB (nitropropane dioxygenase family)
MPAADRIRDLSRWPIVVSPMAGGPTGPALVVAAARAGALPFLAAGNKTPTAMEAEIDAVRGASEEAFGVNVFVPGKPTEDAAALTAYLGSLEAEAEAAAALDRMSLYAGVNFRRAEARRAGEIIAELAAGADGGPGV